VGARSKCLSVRKLDKLLPGLDRTPLREGLAATIAWCRSHPEVFLRPRSGAA
jgi:hypothetical protein